MATQTQSQATKNQDSAMPRTATAVRNFEVTMHRRACLNEAQNARKIIAYVRAINADEAKKAANRLPDKQAFKAISAREVS